VHSARTGDADDGMTTQALEGFKGFKGFMGFKGFTGFTGFRRFKTFAGDEGPADANGHVVGDIGPSARHTLDNPLDRDARCAGDLSG